MDEKTQTTSDVKRNERLTKKLERFLDRACRAESTQDYHRAARCFALALLCEGRLWPAENNAQTYVMPATPVQGTEQVVRDRSAEPVRTQRHDRSVTTPNDV